MIKNIGVVEGGPYFVGYDILHVIFRFADFVNFFG